MTLLPLLTIPLFFFLAVIIKPYMPPRLKWNLCAICIAVSLTWLLLLILSWTGFTIDTVTIALLMGMSITGLLVKIEFAYKKNHLKHLWLARLVTIIGGFYFVFTLLNKKWSTALVLIVTIILILGILSFLLQGITHTDVIKDVEGTEKEKSLLKKLDNCC